MVLKRLIGYILGVGIAIAFGSVALSHQVSAYSGGGYFSGAWTCNTPPGNCSNDPAQSLSYNDDVMPGRAGGGGNALPGYATASKAGFMSWLRGSHGAGGHANAGARFITATMLNDRNQANNLNELEQRIDSPAITMQVINADPNSFGSISFRGNTGDFFWTNSYNAPARPLLIFRHNGDIVYVIEIPCANPVGLPSPGLPLVERWWLDAGAEIRRANPNPQPFITGPGDITINAKLNDTIEWNLWLRNVGDTGMLYTGTTYIGDRWGFPDPPNPVNGGTSWNNGWGINRFPYATNARNHAGGYLFGNWFSGNAFTRYRITNDDVGRTMCQRMAAIPRASFDGDWLRSNMACVHVPYDYNLTPRLTVSKTVVQTPAEPYNVEPVIQHSGTKTQNTDWRVVKFIYNATDPDPSAAGGTFAMPSQSNQPPCTHFTGELNCNDTWRQGNIVITGNWNTIEGDSFGPDFNINRRVCYALAVSRPSHNANPVWGYSEMRCLVVAKRPKVQIWGNDVRVGSGFTSDPTMLNPRASIMTSIVDSGPNIVGSWAEYGLQAPLGVAGFAKSGHIESASGGGLSGPTGAMAPQTAADRNTLSFANNATPYGRWGAPKLFPNFIDDLVKPPYTDPVAPANLDLATGLVAGPRNLVPLGGGTTNIHGALSPDKRTVILYSTGTVTIDGNIETHDHDISSARDVQQIIIIARNIVVRDNVSRVDAWLIARPVNANSGFISTCNTVPGGASMFYIDLTAGGACDSQQLRVNGPIMARELQLRRTAGEDAYAAEIFNMRPDAYMWAAAQAQVDGRIDTMFTTELPPRF